MKKVLFICRGNVGRSQMASELFNSINTTKSDSAGTNPKFPELTVGEIPKAKNAFVVMQELGLDITQNTRRRITPEILDDYDIAICMAEPDTMPDFLTHSPKLEMWSITDPADMDLADTRQIRDQIFAKVKELSAKLA